MAACRNIIESYKEFKDKKLAEGKPQSYVDSKWAETLLVRRTGARRDAIADIIDTISWNRDSITIDVESKGKSKKAKFLDLKEENGRHRVFTSSGTYLFDKGSTKSVDGKVTIPALKGSKKLGARLDDKFNQAGRYERLEKDILKDPSKALDLYDEVGRLENIEIDKSYDKHLKDMLKMFTTGNMIPDVVINLNKKALKSGGAISINETLGEGRIDLAIGQNSRVAANEQSAREKYVHEVGHAVTEFSLAMNTPETSSTKRRLERFRERVRSSIPKEDLIKALMPSNSIDEARERKIAEDMYSYMFENTDSGLSEFLILSVTNKDMRSVVNKVKVYKDREAEYKNWFEWITGKLRDMFRIVRREDRSMMGDELAIKLLMELGKANNKMARKAEGLNVVGKIIDMLDEPAAKLIEKYSETLQSKKIPRKPTNGNKIDNAKWYAKVLQHMIFDERGRHIAEKVFSALGMQPEGIIQTTINKMRDSDTLDKLVETFGLMSQKIDQKRNNLEKVNELAITSAFKKHPSDKEMHAMTLVGLDLDLSTVYGDYDRDTMVKLLNGKTEVQKEIDKLYDELRTKVDDRTFNYYKAQSEGLGVYLATHKSNITQLLNARNIAQGLNRLEPNYNVSTDIISIIDKVSTLQGIKYAHSNQKKLFSDLLVNEPKAMDNFIGIHDAYKKEADKKLFNSRSKHLNIKGYTKEIFNEDITIEIAPINKYKEMRKAGFKLEEILEKAEGDTSSVEMGLYVSHDHLTHNYNRDAIRLTDWNKRGTSLTESRMKGNEDLAKRKAKVDIANIDAEAIKMVSLQEQGKFNVNSLDSKSDGLSPIINEYGKVVDYRYMMSKARKSSLLDQDLRAPLVLGRMIGSIADKVESKEHNKRVFEEVIIPDMKENFQKGFKYGKKNNKEYIVLDEYSPNKDVRDIWRILPTEIQEQVKKYKEPVAVRRDLLFSYFGFRDASIANAPLINKLPAEFKHVIRVAEELWKELVKISKVDIVIRTPMVIFGNITSNFIYFMQMGESPIETAKLQLKAVRDLRDYIDMNRELIKLQTAKDSGNVLGLDVGKIPSLQENLKNSPVAELMDAGMYQAIIEDIGLNEFKASNKWTKKVNDKIENAPQFVRNGLNLAYFTERTTVFKTLTTATQFSDFAARYAQFHLLQKRAEKRKPSKLERERYIQLHERFKDVPETKELLKSSRYKWYKELKAKNYAYENRRELALKQVLDAFVNYNGNDKMSKYLNDIGLVMFTKYFQRIQRVIRQTGTKHPIYMMLVLLGQETLIEMDDISDQSIFTKDLSNMVYSPFDHVMRAITPTAFEWAVDAYKIAT